ncbi:hypothetical protein [Thermococcus celericrescens]|uniref:hypothetical protein n=1 Tax=Thermococcus celericrescens TaxID=227598 RepID=UPI000A67A953|nr:hypothetical protein [Thermococcus celericrescens]
MDHNILVVVPAYNEELTIGSVVALSKRYGDVLVVDDGSKGNIPFYRRVRLSIITEGA